MAGNDAGLAGRGILVTRPAHQADALCARIEALGGEPVRFPVLDILPPVQPDAARARLAQLSGYDMAVFVSANAVEHALALLAPAAWPRSVGIAAIGAATARALRERGLEVALSPPREFTSEALLALPQLQRLDGRRVLILRGNGGREHLRQGLESRGARVDYLEVYRRAQAAADPGPLLRRWQAGGIAATLVTSDEGLRCLLAIIGTLGLPLLRTTPLVVANARTRDLARTLGLDGPVEVAADATDQAMVEALRRYFSGSGDTGRGAS